MNTSSEKKTSNTERTAQQQSSTNKIRNTDMDKNQNDLLLTHISQQVFETIKTISDSLKQLTEMMNPFSPRSPPPQPVLQEVKHILHQTRPSEHQSTALNPLQHITSGAPQPYVSDKSNTTSALHADYSPTFFSVLSTCRNCYIPPQMAATALHRVSMTLNV